MQWRGIRFYRYPDSVIRADRVYWTPGIADRQRGIRRLHEEIWQAAYGPIPDGHHVHHRDHDPLNNDLANLVLITATEHHRHHYAERVERLGPTQFTVAARDAAAAWHASAAGRAWHVEHGARTWANRKTGTRICAQCGGSYESRSRKGNEAFCSNACRAAARRAAGVDDVERRCQRCGIPFRVSRYAKTRFCSRSCANKRT
jgi:hypothetical protein